MNIFPKRGLHYGLFRKTSPPWHADSSTSTALVVMRANSDTTRSMRRAMNRANQCPCRTISTAACFFRDMEYNQKCTIHDLSGQSHFFSSGHRLGYWGRCARSREPPEQWLGARLVFLFRGPKMEAHPTLGLEQGSVRFGRSGICGIGRWFSRGGARNATSTPFIHEGPRRTTSTPFIHEGPRRAAKDREEHL